MLYYFPSQRTKSLVVIPLEQGLKHEANEILSDIVFDLS